MDSARVSLSGRLVAAAVNLLARLLPRRAQAVLLARFPGSWSASMVRQAVLAGYERLNRTGRLDSRLLDRDVEWLPDPDSPTAGVYRGPGAAAGELEEWTEPFEDFRWEPTEILESGGPGGDWRWFVAGRMKGRGKGSGVETEIEEFHIWTLRRARAVRLEMYLDRADALRAAGLAAEP